MDPITQSEYYLQCQAIAVEAVQEAEGDHEQAYDSIHETVDGHQWILYTYYNLQVLTHSRNADAYFDEIGGPLEASSYSDVMVKLAFYAMKTDVCEYLEDALTEYADTHTHTQSRSPRHE